MNILKHMVAICLAWTLAMPAQPAGISYSAALPEPGKSLAAPTYFKPIVTVATGVESVIEPPFVRFHVRSEVRYDPVYAAISSLATRYASFEQVKAGFEKMLKYSVGAVARQAGAKPGVSSRAVKLQIYVEAGTVLVTVAYAAPGPLHVDDSGARYPEWFRAVADGLAGTGVEAFPCVSEKGVKLALRVSDPEIAGAFERECRSIVIVKDAAEARLWRELTYRAAHDQGPGEQAGSTAAGRSFYNRVAFRDISTLIGQFLYRKRPVEQLIGAVEKHLDAAELAISETHDPLLQGYCFEEIYADDDQSAFYLPIYRKGRRAFSYRYSLKKTGETGEMAIPIERESPGVAPRNVYVTLVPVDTEGDLLDRDFFEQARSIAKSIFPDMTRLPHIVQCSKDQFVRVLERAAREHPDAARSSPRARDLFVSYRPAILYKGTVYICPDIIRELDLKDKNGYAQMLVVQKIGEAFFSRMGPEEEEWNEWAAVLSSAKHDVTIVEYRVARLLFTSLLVNATILRKEKIRYKEVYRDTYYRLRHYFKERNSRYYKVLNVYLRALELMTDVEPGSFCNIQYMRSGRRDRDLDARVEDIRRFAEQVLGRIERSDSPHKTIRRLMHSRTTISVINALIGDIVDPDTGILEDRDDRRRIEAPDLCAHTDSAATALKAAADLVCPLAARQDQPSRDAWADELRRIAGDVTYAFDMSVSILEREGKLLNGRTIDIDPDLVSRAIGRVDDIREKIAAGEVVVDDRDEVLRLIDEGRAGLLAFVNEVEREKGQKLPFKIEFVRSRFLSSYNEAVFNDFFAASKAIEKTLRRSFGLNVSPQDIDKVTVEHFQGGQNRAVYMISIIFRNKDVIDKLRYHPLRCLMKVSLTAKESSYMQQMVARVLNGQLDRPTEFIGKLSDGRMVLMGRWYPGDSYQDILLDRRFNEYMSHYKYTEAQFNEIQARLVEASVRVWKMLGHRFINDPNPAQFVVWQSDKDPDRFWVNLIDKGGVSMGNRPIDLVAMPREEREVAIYTTGASSPLTDDIHDYVDQPKIRMYLDDHVPTMSGKKLILMLMQYLDLNGQPAIPQEFARTHVVYPRPIVKGICRALRRDGAVAFFTQYMAERTTHDESVLYEDVKIHYLKELDKEIGLFLADPDGYARQNGIALDGMAYGDSDQEIFEREDAGQKDILEDARSESRKVDEAIESAEEPVIVALGTDWMKGYRKGQYLQYDALKPLMISLRQKCESRRIVFIEAPDEELPGKIAAARGQSGASKVIVLAHKNAVRSGQFFDLRADKKATVVGVDDSQLTVDSYIRLCEMLSIAFDLSNNAENALVRRSVRIVKDVEYGLYILIPPAEPMDYERLKHTYEVQFFA